jgi:hypothetical protein
MRLAAVVAATAALAALAIPMTSTWSSAQPSHTRVDDSRSASSTARTVGHAPTRRELIGTWRPTTLLGEDVSAKASINGSPVTLRFADSGPSAGWTGYDGCNWASGPFHLGEAGVFSATWKYVTLRGCHPYRVTTHNVDVIEKAHRLVLRGGRLVLFDAAGHRIGTYVRTS